MKNPPFSHPNGLDPQEIRSEAETRHKEKGGAHAPKTESYEIKALLHELEVHQIELEIQKEELESAYEQKSQLLEEYSDLYDFSPVGYLSLDFEGNILNVNLRATSILNRNRADLSAQNFYLYIDASDRHRFEDYLNTLPRAPEKNSIELKLKDLSHYVELEGFITSDPEQIRLVMIDRTRVKTSESENIRLLAAIEGTADTIEITDDKGDIIYVNHAFEVATGYHKDEVLGRNPRFLKGGNLAPSFYQEMWNTLTSGKTWRGTFRNKMKDGTLVDEDATITPILNDQWRITHYVAVKRNVTQLRSLEAQLQQAQKMEAVGRLAGGVAHEFNNLLMAMMGYSDLCGDQMQENHPAQEYLSEIRNSIDRASNTTKQLLVFARKQAYHPVVVDLNDRVTQTFKLLQHLLGESFPLLWEPEKEASLLTMIDPIQLDQVLANLCINAKDAYATKGEIILRTGKTLLSSQEAEMEIDIEPGNYVWFSVSDKGSGMSEETQKHIFEPFFTTKDIGKGTGLGLAILYGIVKQHKGFIRVDSQENIGSTLTIFLPESLEKMTLPPKGSSGQAPMGNGETLLLVDDEMAIRSTVQHILISLGYNVLIAESPKQALELHTRHLTIDKFRLVLSDIMMPEMTGIEMVRLMKEKQPDIKVLYMTGHIVGTGLQDIERESPEIILHKPFTRMSLGIKIKELLASKIS